VSEPTEAQAAMVEKIAARVERERPCCKGKPHSDFDFPMLAMYIRSGYGATIADELAALEER
jgi:hypothetical protein